uniref:Uncharacterized protein n=1 Tax=Timema poppense TaxID=170557 RepID=A0A7R9DCD8_TIMPO|nr:unnamed protein product [Timema poppensis]
MCNLARECGVGRATVHDPKKKRQKIVEHVKTMGSAPGKQRGHDISEADLNSWFEGNSEEIEQMMTGLQLYWWLCGFSLFQHLRESEGATLSTTVDSAAQHNPISVYHKVNDVENARKSEKNGGHLEGEIPGLEWETLGGRDTRSRVGDARHWRVSSHSLVNIQCWWRQGPSNTGLAASPTTDKRLKISLTVQPNSIFPPSFHTYRRREEDPETSPEVAANPLGWWGTLNDLKYLPDTLNLVLNSRWFCDQERHQRRVLILHTGLSTVHIRQERSLGVLRKPAHFPRVANNAQALYAITCVALPSRTVTLSTLCAGIEERLTPLFDIIGLEIPPPIFSFLDAIRI